MSFDAFMRAAPGVLGRGLAGRNAGIQQRFRNDLLQAESDQRAQRLMLEEALLQARLTPPPPQPDYVEGVDPESGQVAYFDRTSGKKTVTGLLKQQPTPKAPRYSYFTGRGKNGRPVRMQVNEDTGEQREMGEEYRAPTQAAGAGGPGKMSAGMFDKVVKLQGALENIDLALGTLQSNPEAAGEAMSSTQMLRGMPSFLGRVAGRNLDQNLPTPARQMRAQIASVSSMLLNLLSGAAISEHEYERLKLYVPDVNQDAPDVAADKLQNLRRELQGALGRYQGGAGVPEDGPTSEDMDPADYFDALIAAGLSEQQARRQTELKYGPPPE